MKAKKLLKKLATELIRIIDTAEIPEEKVSRFKDIDQAPPMESPAALIEVSPKTVQEAPEIPTEETIKQQQRQIEELQSLLSQANMKSTSQAMSNFDFNFKPIGAPSNE